jgi:hypothetical protein
VALPWVRMDTQWPHNPKFLMLVEDAKWRAIALYWAALGWSGAQGMDGFVPYYALPMVHGTKKNALELVEVALWVPTSGGWDINGYSEFQPSSEEHEKRSKRARDAAMTRWHGKNGNGSTPDPP